MTSHTQPKSVPLNVMVGAAIVVWAAAFASVYGPFVFGYVAMHAVTTGVFLLAIRRADRRHEDRAMAQPAMTSSSSPAKQKTLNEARTTPQPVA